ncbi:MAG: DNA polymerase I, partial [Clostridia bacterium]|nr:DNA polymerase I [Clostridia bacterium]
LSTKDGTPTNAVFAFINIIKKNMDAVRPDFAVCAFDLHEPTFRHKMYSEYKAGRHKMPDELAVQLPIVKEFCEYYGLHVATLPGYEADDIIGTTAALANKEGIDAYILTGDRDSLQLISKNTTVLLASNKETISYDRDLFFENIGIYPEEFVDMKALMGDSSDNIPGVRGVGKETAAKLIAKFHSLENLYENIDDDSISKGLREKLINGKDDAYMSRALSQIDINSPVDFAISDCSADKKDVKKLSDFLARYELYSMISRLELDKMGKVGDSQAAVLTKEEKIISKDELFAFDKTKKIYAEISEGDLYLCKDGEVYAVKDFTSDGKAAAKFFQTFENIYTFNSKALYRSLLETGNEPHKVKFDAMLAAYVLDPSDGTEDSKKLIFTHLSASTDDANAATCVYYKSELCEHLSKKLENSACEKLYYDIEMPLAMTLARMEHYGFKIDISGLSELSEKFDEMTKDLQNRIWFSAGEEFNINSPKQLGIILFEKLGLPAPKGTKTGYSTSAETLEKYAPYHPIIGDILEYRKITKLNSTYAQGLVKAADKDGRIHTKFNQTVTNTGRLSSAEPNLQNIPIRTELGREFRKYFIPENSDYVLIDADYSQIELRLLAHIANDKAMIAAFLSETDIHTSTAADVFGVSANEVTKEQRRRAKAVNFGIMYGIGDYSLALDIGVSRKQAAEYIENYLNTYPQIRLYLENVVKNAAENGYSETIFGRRRFIPELRSSNKNIQAFGKRVAMNSPIQGSAADIIKLAMIRISERLNKEKYDAHLILQVHDELVVECRRDIADKVSKIVKDEMENAAALRVPLTVDMFVADNWYK